MVEFAAWAANTDMLAEFTAQNALALESLAGDPKIQFRRLPERVLARCAPPAKCWTRSPRARPLRAPGGPAARLPRAHARLARRVRGAVPPGLLLSRGRLLQSAPCARP